MSAITLNLTKDGEGKKIQLNLTKEAFFRILLAWKGKTDLDLHALLCINNGTKSVITSEMDILSTYNVKRMINGREVGCLPLKPDRTFEIYDGALVHSPDALDGDEADIDEYVEVHQSKLKIPAGCFIEIVLLAMIHPQNGQARFENVEAAWTSIQDENGTELLRANLSDQFGKFTGVQMGSIIIDETGVATFHSVSQGFECDFNAVLGNFC